MDKIKVQICLGTTCFVMGGASLKTMAEDLTHRFGDKIEVCGVTCLGACSGDNNFSKAPYVRVNDTLIGDATLDKVIAQIEAVLD